MGLTQSVDVNKGPQCWSSFSPIGDASIRAIQELQHEIEESRCEHQFYEEAKRKYFYKNLELQLIQTILMAVFVFFFLITCCCHFCKRGSNSQGTRRVLPRENPNFSGVQQPGPYAPNFPPSTSSPQ